MCRGAQPPCAPAPPHPPKKSWVQFEGHCLVPCKPRLLEARALRVCLRSLNTGAQLLVPACPSSHHLLGNRVLAVLCRLEQDQPRLSGYQTPIPNHSLVCVPVATSPLEQSTCHFESRAGCQTLSGLLLPAQRLNLHLLFFWYENSQEQE